MRPRGYNCRRDPRKEHILAMKTGKGRALKAALCGVLAAAVLAALLAGCKGTKQPGGEPADPGEGNVPGAGKALKELEEMLSRPETVPVSFKYDGASVRGLGTGFTKLSQTASEEADGTRYDVRFKHIDSGAEFRLDAKAYKDFDALAVYEHSACRGRRRAVFDFVQQVLWQKKS